jgi:O-antigen/teichoic acid export membrane protein
MYSDYDDTLRPSQSPPLPRKRTSDNSLLGHALATSERLINSDIRTRIAAAALIYVADIILARWTGAREFGIYVYVWAFLLLLSDLLPLGFSSAAQHFIPEYIRDRMLQHMRGFIQSSRWIVFGVGALAALACAAIIDTKPEWFDAYEVLPLYLACITLPFFAISNLLNGIARACNLNVIAPIRPFILRPTLFLILIVEAYAFGAPPDAVTAMTAGMVAVLATSIVELLLLDRQLTRSLGEGPRCLDLRGWLRASSPAVFIWGFYTLITYTDIILLQFLRPPEDVALYHAASKTLAFVAFIYLAIDAAIAHRFTEQSLSGDPAELSRFMKDASRWTFWPSFAGVVLMLLLGIPLLWLFGPGFTAGYPLIGILAIGLLARTAVGPAERLLTMLGNERVCGYVYASAFAVNVGICLTLIPQLGVMGAALGTTGALITEAALLFIIMRRRLQVPLFGSVFRLPKLDSLTGEQ